MRMGFWRGVLTGSIIGAAIGMMTGTLHQKDRKGILGYSTHQAKNRAHKVLRGVSKSVNNLIK